ncbi:MbtH family protein [Nocardiopsis quinghaiensis]|uniref:MbtH family protein n=1 Tax=Nocardiopsis quinghaiensis TaxID=464995 RepID=UPI0012384B69|nr:MbtH family protein [Nocardiopsis quinghaiensis]
MNPFDDPNGEFVVFVNDEGQHSLWPARLDRPAGWERAFGPDSREACLRYVEENWDGLRLGAPRETGHVG